MNKYKFAQNPASCSPSRALNRPRFFFSSSIPHLHSSSPRFIFPNVQHSYISYVLTEHPLLPKKCTRVSTIITDFMSMKTSPNLLATGYRVGTFPSLSIHTSR
ncbi:hypothetical protein CEXT_234091 [Caerostris extrusa]|uniref:Uncharacterized protein n=1 Tax=Caerostris extrusa TaxID=172846 RepID=A0AAV4X3H4_CAEEX|nr:hypothetical protein CEXT_234091 [Caerostris extrusa]